MYNNVLDNLMRQKDRIEDMIKNYQQPVNNFITQTPNKDLIEWRILNENEEVDNLYVQNKTLFINDNMMVLKGVDGKLEKWEVKKIYPIDKKDEKINELENEIKKLKEIIENEHTEFNEPDGKFEQPDADDFVFIKSRPKSSGKSISK